MPTNKRPPVEYTPDATPARWTDEQRCIARKKADGTRCRTAHLRDMEVCGAHGGRAPQAKAAAKRRGLVRDAKSKLAKLNVTPVSDPLTELSLLAGQVVAFKDSCADLVNKLESIRYADAKGAEQLRSEVVVFTQALAECRQVLGLMAKLDIDSRLAAIEETKARAVVAAVDYAIAAAGVVGPAAVEARQAVARRLRSVS